MTVREHELGTFLGEAVVVCAMLLAGCGMQGPAGVSPSTPQMGSLLPSLPQSEDASPTLRHVENWHLGLSIIVASSKPLPAGKK